MTASLTDSRFSDVVASAMITGTVSADLVVALRRRLDHVARRVETRAIDSASAAEAA